MLRQEIATRLRDSGQLALLTGGIWPHEDAQSSALTKKAYPAAFDSKGEILPTALVQDGGMFALPTTRQTVSDTFEVIVWQQRGRESIDGALAKVFTVLNGAAFGAGTAWVYELQFAGEGPNVRDQALADAEQGRSRWQAILLR